jgi:hypothetical protein
VHEQARQLCLCAAYQSRRRPQHSTRYCVVTIIVTVERARVLHCRFCLAHNHRLLFSAFLRQLWTYASVINLHVHVQALMFAMHRATQDVHASTGPIVHLISAGASVAARNSRGLSALMIACTSVSGHLWRLLVRLSEKDIILQVCDPCETCDKKCMHSTLPASD